MKTALRGIYPALLTPFDSEGRVNVGVLEKLIQYNLDKGVTGFYVGGSTAEAFLLSEQERNLVYEVAAKTVNGKAKLFAHIGCISTEQAIAFGKTAEKYQYDAISAIAPFYYKFNFAQIKKYYYDIVDAVSLPMIIYNFPNFSGVNMSVEQVSEFFRDERFIGIKHTSNDYFALEQFKTHFSNHTVFNGFDEMMVAGLSMGADGGIGSTYNFMAEKFIRIMQLVDEDKLEEARTVQKEANRIIKALCTVGVMEGEKEVLNQLGFDFGGCRAPFSVLTDEQKRYIRENITETL